MAIKNLAERIFCKHEQKKVECSECMIRNGISKIAQFECAKCGRKRWDVTPYSILNKNK